MMNGMIAFVQGLSIWQIISLVGSIGTSIGVFWYFQDKILPRFHKKSVIIEKFLYKKCKKLQQEDFGIQWPPDAKKEVYSSRDSDDKIRDILNKPRRLLIIGIPKAGRQEVHSRLLFHHFQTITS